MNKATEDRIVALAFMHRYGWIAGMLWSCMVRKEYTPFLMGGFFILYAIWSVLGYRWKWKHVYCSWQSSSHEPITPYCIIWERMSLSEAYGTPILFFILGLSLIVIYVI